MAAIPLMPAPVPYTHPCLLLSLLLPCLLLLRLVLDQVIQLQDRDGMSATLISAGQSPSACLSRALQRAEHYCQRA